MLLMSAARYGNGGYLDHVDAQFHALFGEKKWNVLLIPYGTVSFTYDYVESRARVAFERTGHTISSIHFAASPRAAIERADAIAISDGNTFALLKRLYNAKLMDVLRMRILSGIPLVAWGAGANIACPTIQTTNDMPVVQPPSFDALRLLPFQTNPHFITGKMPAHNEKSREDRLNEFLDLNPNEEVLAMPEGTALLVEGANATALGDSAMLWFRQQRRVVPIKPGVTFNLNSIAVGQRLMIVDKNKTPGSKGEADSMPEPTFAKRDRPSDQAP
jgi:dipeptidase E